jgi:tetratricopeptide (TPR) repeat protein
LSNQQDVALSLLDGLRQDIIERQMRSGMDRLDAHLSLLQEMDARSTHAPQIIWRVAQWVDAGWRDISIVQAALSRLPRACRGNLPLRDYAAIRMADGMVAMSVENVDEAVAHFNTVLLFDQDTGDRELLAIANFWKARCHRKKGEYEPALQHTVQARTLAAQCGFERMAAVMRVLESWLCFQKNKHKESLRILGETEAVLSATDDYLVLGNIQSTYGRIYRQEGRYDRAVHHFNLAIEEYRKVDPHHQNLARTLANIAYVKRLVALDVRKKIDAGLARKRHGNGRTEPGPDQVRQRDEFARTRDEAYVHLDEAEAICAIHPNHHVSGTVHLNRGLLHLDSGALDEAEEQAARAFDTGEEKGDGILMARARMLQCMIENSKVEEGIEDDPRVHAQAALDYIRDAIELAQSTQNRRLLARVHTWHGLTLSNEYFCAQDAAMEALNTASGFLDHGFHDTAYEDLRTLKARLAKSHSVDETLLAWSQGAVGDRTFREIEEQFAEIIIPRVWEIEGRKIARVATRLSVSPKKVRRALTRAGVLGRHAGHADAAGAE